MTSEEFDEKHNKWRLGRSELWHLAVHGNLDGDFVAYAMRHVEGSPSGPGMVTLQSCPMGEGDAVHCVSDMIMNIEEFQ